MLWVWRVADIIGLVILYKYSGRPMNSRCFRSFGGWLDFRASRYFYFLLFLFLFIYLDLPYCTETNQPDTRDILLCEFFLSNPLNV